MNQTNESTSWLVIIVGAVLFILAFVLHTFVPILLIVPLFFIAMRKKTPEQYYVPPSSNEQAASTISSDSSPARPKDTPRWEYDQPMAEYPEQMPPMS